jgi:hypothetical protein
MKRNQFTQALQSRAVAQLMILCDPRHVIPPVGLSQVFSITYSLSAHRQNGTHWNYPDQHLTGDRKMTTELKMSEMDQVSGTGVLDWIAEKAEQTVKFYAGLAGGMAGGRGFAKAAHEAGKNAGIIGTGGTQVTDNGDGKGCTDPNIPFL